MGIFFKVEEELATLLIELECMSIVSFSESLLISSLLELSTP